MGNYINTGLRDFEIALNSGVYIDKSMLISGINRLINTNDRFICMARPRRFGKTITANMLSAYYDSSVDSHPLFDSLRISSDTSYLTHLNKYTVIHIDLQQFCDKSPAEAVKCVQKLVSAELKELFPDANIPLDDTEADLAGAIAETGNKYDIRFVIIIDEWDMFLRDGKQDEQEVYVNLLRRLFKSTSTNRHIALAYLTGILPIIRYNTESALNNFREYTMLDPGAFAEYFGFTSEEVRALCDEHSISYEETERWYDGYLLGGHHVFNPYAITCMIDGGFKSYWSRTVSFSSLLSYIDYDYDGLKSTIVAMLGGNPQKVRVMRFSNNSHEIRNRDDAITLLIHYGYLSFDENTDYAAIPNEEIRSVFFETLQESQWSIVPLLERSDELLDAMLNGNSDLVAEYVEKAHEEYASILTYNHENDLSCVIRLAFYTASKYYTMVREMPTGKGFADIVLLPNKGVEKPAVLIELKWDKSAETALQQIKAKDYPAVLANFTGEILLVGISYDKETKKHECCIEELAKVKCKSKRNSRGKRGIKDHKISE